MSNLEQEIKDSLLWLEPIERAGELDQAQRLLLTFARALQDLLPALKVARHAIYHGSFPIGWTIDDIDKALSLLAEKKI